MARKTSARAGIGILGGTFDPIHRGHIEIARAALRARGLERVLIVPADRPPHKREVAAPARDRLEMVRIACRGEEGLVPSDLEIRRSGVSYTHETLEELTRLHPGARLHFIIGEDSVPELPKWRRLDRILDLAEILTAARPGSGSSFSPERFPGIPAETLARCERNRIPVDPVPASSTAIRTAIRSGLPFDADLPPGVGDYIRRHGLYGYTNRERRTS